MERRRTNEAAINWIKEQASDSNVCMIITTDAEGKTHNRPMGAVRIEDDGSCWFFASKSSGKIRDIEVNNKIQVIFADSASESYVEVHGAGSVVCDEQEIMNKWSPLVSQWFPNGIKDPQVCLVRIEITSVFYWDDRTEGIQRLSINKTTVVEEQRLAA